MKIMFQKVAALELYIGTSASNIHKLPVPLYQGFQVPIYCGFHSWSFAPVQLFSEEQTSEPLNSLAVSHLCFVMISQSNSLLSGRTLDSSKHAHRLAGALCYSCMCAFALFICVCLSVCLSPSLPCVCVSVSISPMCACVSSSPSLSLIFQHYII